MKSTKPNGGRNRLSRAGAMTMLVIALVGFQFNVPTGTAQSVGIEFIFDVVPDNAPLSAALPTGTTFYLQGKVYPFRTVNMANCTFNVASPRQVGTWRAWGQAADDGLVVINQSLMINTVGGMIEIQGTTGVIQNGGGATPAVAGTSGPPFTGPTELLSVTGGVGAYKGLNGEARVRGYCVQDPSLPFRYDRAFCIGIVEAKRK